MVSRLQLASMGGSSRSAASHGQDTPWLASSSKSSVIEDNGSVIGSRSAGGRGKTDRVFRDRTRPFPMFRSNKLTPRKWPPVAAVLIVLKIQLAQSLLSNHSGLNEVFQLAKQDTKSHQFTGK